MPLEKDRDTLKIPKGSKAIKWRNWFIFGGIAYTIVGFAYAYKFGDLENSRIHGASERFEKHQADRLNRLERIIEKRKEQARLRDEPYEDSSTIAGGGRGLGRIK